MILSNWVIGAILGFIVGAITYFILSSVERKMMHQGKEREAKMLNFVKKVDFASMPFIGAFIGYMIGENFL